MSYTWDDIFRTKTDRELFQMYLKGTFAEKNKAAEYLKARGFDFENVQKYKEEWELEKLLNEYRTWKTGIYEQLLGFDMLPIIPMVNLLAIVLVIGDIIFQLTGNKEKELFQYLLVLAGLIIFEVFLIWLNRKREQKRSRIKARIAELRESLRNKRITHANTS